MSHFNLKVILIALMVKNKLVNSEKFISLVHMVYKTLN
jgi:hypothetical protein